ncbi:hypothetical protein [Neotabrizicola shimadae]|uniref:Uncharacterized protein n=1 Tax=Neotabrizicola shimadae TaxID=2807096 RepID=A0A8G1ECM7_9RHOB|nr:hypothetical protein [Neotabrizicola shimadae]QYZ68534.1 hypothetical protein JO391_12150 [Neotabrizicola shimadae]
MRLTLRPPSRIVPALVVLALLAGCVALPGGKGDAVEANALAAEAIAVTPLDGAAAAPVAAPVAAAAAEPEAATPATAAETDGKAEPEAGAEAPAEEAEAPPPPKPPEQLACERKGGSWASAGGSGAKACVKRTRDAGKQCTTGRQCEGDCLARSQTCSPITPLFGCNEILQDNGARVNQCIE